MNDKLKMKKVKELRIDPDVSWREEHNREVARKLGWRYDSRRRIYVDGDGEMVADRFGQPL